MELDGKGQYTWFKFLDFYAKAIRMPKQLYFILDKSEWNFVGFFDKGK